MEPVPGGRPSLRGRSLGATVLLLPFGRPDPGFRFGGDGGLSGGIYMSWSNEWCR